MATAKKSAATVARNAAAAKAAGAGEGELYDVLGNLHHDGTAYGLGDQVTLDAVAAEPLLACGAVKPAEAAPAAK